MTENSPFSAKPKRLGRPKGNRNKLAQRYFEDLYHAWEEQGESVIARAMFQDPVAVLGIIGRLMPQKLEITTPTDGMSDERLAEMLDLAERMAALKAGVVIDGSAMVVHGDAGVPLRLEEGISSDDSPAGAVPLQRGAADENGIAINGFEGRGGGPDARMGGVGINTPHTQSGPDGFSADQPPKQHNGLEPHSQKATEAAEIPSDPPPKKHNGLEAWYAETYKPPKEAEQIVQAPPHPVGRPVPLADTVVEARNIAKLSDIDPEDLF